MRNVKPRLCLLCCSTTAVMRCHIPRLTARIAAFMAVLPRGPLYAVEVRDSQLVSREFAAAIRDAGAAPCLAAHARMPHVAEQAAAFGLDAADCPLPLVARWNLHAGRGYEEAKADYFPFHQLVDEDPARLRQQAATPSSRSTTKPKAPPPSPSSSSPRRL
jgi:hypothetical protein